MDRPHPLPEVVAVRRAEGGLDLREDGQGDLLGLAEAIAAEAALARTEAAPPSSAIVWWRAQMRARQE